VSVVLLLQYDSFMEYLPIIGAVALGGFVLLESKANERGETYMPAAKRQRTV